MAAIRYMGPIWHFPTYLLRAAIRSMYTKFNQNRFKTERLAMEAAKYYFEIPKISQTIYTYILYNL